eukprot:4972471-Alexandrium_andersonii.AAC.1
MLGAGDMDGFYEAWSEALNRTFAGSTVEFGQQVSQRPKGKAVFKSVDVLQQWKVPRHVDNERQE